LSNHVSDLEKRLSRQFIHRSRQKRVDDMCKTRPFRDYFAEQMGFAFT
jgi:hypothetical protein